MSYDYNDVERIRLADFDAPELPDGAGQRSKRELQSTIAGRSLEIHIKGRDRYGRLVADILVVG